MCGVGAELGDPVRHRLAVDHPERGWGDDVAAVTAEVDPRIPRLPRPLLAVFGCWVVEVQATRGRAHRECPPGDQVGLVGAVQGVVAVRAVHVHIHHDQPEGSAGGDADVRLREAPPPRLDLTQIGRGIPEAAAVADQRHLVARRDREHRHPRSRKPDRGPREGLVGGVEEDRRQITDRHHSPRPARSGRASSGSTAGAARSAPRSGDRRWVSRSRPGGVPSLT